MRVCVQPRGRERERHREDTKRESERRREKEGVTQRYGPSEKVKDGQTDKLRMECCRAGRGENNCSWPTERRYDWLRVIRGDSQTGAVARCAS